MEYVALFVIMALAVMVGMTGYFALIMALGNTRKVRTAFARWSLRYARETQSLLEEMDEEDD